MSDDEIRMPASRGLRALAAAIAVLETVGVVLVVSATRSNPGLMISTLVPFAVGYGLAWVMARACIVLGVDGNGVRLAFEPLWRRAIPADEVAAVELLPDVSPARYGGIGYRRVPGRTLALLWHGGPAVQVTTTEGDHFVVVTHEAARLAARIEALR